jgi:hypothetical protein
VAPAGQNFVVVEILAESWVERSVGVGNLNPWFRFHVLGSCPAYLHPTLSKDFNNHKVLACRGHAFLVRKVSIQMITLL